MKPIFYVSCLILIGLCNLRAADKPMTAFEVLKEARKLLGNPVGENLISMEAENAKLRPRLWWLRFYDQSLFLKIRAILMVGPEMNKNIIPGNPFGGGDLNYIIPKEAFKIDSEKCITFMEKAAKENKIPLHSLNILLKKPHPGESNPVWYFIWRDERDDTLGEIHVSATTGKIVDMIDLKIKINKSGVTPRKGFVGEVEDTFLGIGADLEEVFTGKRTIDQPE